MEVKIIESDAKEEDSREGRVRETHKAVENEGMFGF